MSIKLQQLKHFVMVVEEGGFRAASHRANRSQAALSTSIKELEKILGQTLFEPGKLFRIAGGGLISVSNMGVTDGCPNFKRRLGAFDLFVDRNRNRRVVPLGRYRTRDGHANDAGFGHVISFRIWAGSKRPHHFHQVYVQADGFGRPGGT